MRALSLIGLMLGAVLVVALVHASAGLSRSLLSTRGVEVMLGALLGASAYRLVSLSLNTRSWQVLLPSVCRPAFWPLFRLRWIGESINTLLPVAQVGGDLVRARLLTPLGVPAATAAGTMFADLTAGVASQVLFTALGMMALAAGTGLGRFSTAVTSGLLLLGGLGLALAVVSVGLRQDLGRSRLWHRASRRWPGLAVSRAAFQQALGSLLGRRRALVASLGWHVGGWLSQMGETWLVLQVLGAPAPWSSALIIESLSATARGAAFFVPGGLGVQEGVVVALGGHLGLPLEVALALSLVKRLREVVVGLPGLLTWLLVARDRTPGEGAPS
jgi:putative membrane protein